MSTRTPPPARPRATIARRAAAVALAVAVVATPAIDRVRRDDGTPKQVPGAVGATPTAPASRMATAGPVVALAPLVVRPAPPNLPVFTYTRAPRGFPADRQSGSTAPLTLGLRPNVSVPLYNAPGGYPKAFLTPKISGVRVTVPIVKRDRGWVAVLLPSVNRRIAWLPKGGWSTVRLRDQLIVERRSHKLIWRRDGRRLKTWRVTLGMGRSPTPLGRTFVLGRTRLYGFVYADTDVFALGAVPDDKNAVPTALRGAHIGIHTWYHDGELGRNTSDGCIRLTRGGQRLLLANLRPGTPVVVTNR